MSFRRGRAGSNLPARNRSRINVIQWRPASRYNKQWPVGQESRTDGECGRPLSWSEIHETGSHYPIAQHVNAFDATPGPASCGWRGIAWFDAAEATESSRNEPAGSGRTAGAGEAGDFLVSVGRA